MPAPDDRERPGVPASPLPLVASSFVGRVADLDAIAERFEDGAQLVTVTGLGGVGKTRLALRFAEAQAASAGAPGAGGVWFCDLTGVYGATSACAAVASALGLQLGADEAAQADHLGRALARRGRALIVLDNFEQLADLADATLGRWLQSARRARFLVTSRVALGLPGEHLWPLHPLPLPPLELHDAAGLAAVESVDLFVRRARQRRPDLALRPDDLAAIADIVRRLDGIPLAIELAAARISALSVIQLRDRLADRLALLIRHGDDGRHGSMRRAIADSWDLLRPAEQDCLAGCTVFAGGFTLAAAEAVLTRDVGPVLPLLESLCLRSLVRATPRPDLDGELRFSLYETIREYAAERLAAAPELAARLADHHAAHYADLARALAPPAAAAGGQAAARLDLDLDNLLAGHAHALACAHPDAVPRALALACGAHRPLIRRGMAGEAVRLLDAALALARPTAASLETAPASPGPTSATLETALASSGPAAEHDAVAPARPTAAAHGAVAPARPSAVTPAELAAAVLARGQAHRLRGAWQRARVDFEAGLALAQAAGDPILEALGHTRLGELVETDGATGEARARFTTALACLARAPGDPLGPLHEADVRTRLAHAFRREGELDHAERQIQQALELHRAAARSDDLPMALYEAGVIAWFRGRHDEALARYDEGLARAEATDAHARGALLYVRAILLQERGDLDAAFDHYVRALERIRDSGDLYLEASALYYFAGAHLERGQHDDAARLLERALAMFRELGVPRYQALTESCRATLFAGAGDLEAARRCLAAAEEAALACRSEGALTATVAIHGLHVRMAVTDPRTRQQLLTEARALAEAHPSDDSRFALRAALAGLARAEPRPPSEPLIVRANARALRLPGAAADVDLSRRAPLQRLVLALARRRIEAPGEALSLADLLAAGWPGERVGDSAGTNRVHVALSTLRNLGLRPYLVSGRDGYALTSTSPCTLEHDE